MRTSEVKLSSGRTVKIRRPGWSAMTAIEAMMPASAVRAFSKAKAESGDESNVATFLTTEEIDEVRRIGREQRIARVVAGLVDPIVTAASIDDEIEYEEFAEIEAAIVRLSEEAAAVVDPSLAMTGS